MVLEAVRYIEAVGVGVTKPHLLRASDGHLYIVKLTSNKLGPKALANEYLGSRLGELLHLSFPRAGLIHLSHSALDTMPLLRRLGAPPGVHFAVRYLSRSEYVRPWHLRQAVNRREFAGVILFDHILQNEDRTLNRRNLLARYEKQGIRLYAIDNTHLFGSGCWHRENLMRYADVVRINDRLAYGCLLRRYLKPMDFQPYLDKIHAVVPEKINAILEEIPAVWLDEDDRRSVKAVVMARLSMADRIADVLCRLIPNQHRRADRYQLK